MKPILEVRDVKKSFDNLNVLDGASFTVQKGEIKCIVGPSGGGKTTILRCISMLEEFDEGEIVFDGRVVIRPDSSVAHRRKAMNMLGVVFQDFNLWPNKSVLDNIVEPLVLVKKLSQKRARKKAMLLLEKVGLRSKAGGFPDFLSGGQKQRVAIARTLAMDPKILLFDEITSALDPELVGGILRLIKRLAKEGQTMLVVTHHLKFASEIADSLLFMDGGKIAEEGSPRNMLYGAKYDRTREFLRTVVTHGQEINVYEGYEDFRAFLIGLLRRMPSRTTGYVIGAAGDRWYECLGETIEEYERIRKEKNIKWKMVIYKLSANERRTMKKMPGLTDYRIIPRALKVPSNMNIWGDTVLLQMFGNPPAIIEIKNKALAEGYLNYFNLLWKQGKKV